MTKKTGRKRGRPPAFERQVVLEKAAEAFWRFGYEGTSIAILTAAMGVSPQSLYAAFGSKLDLYEESLDWYADTLGRLQVGSLDDAHVIDAVRALLHLCAEDFTNPNRPAGCMISIAALGCAADNDPARALALHRREIAKGMLRERVHKAVVDGELRADAPIDALALYLASVIQGLSVQAHDGAPREQLRVVADMTAAHLELWRA